MFLIPKGLDAREGFGSKLLVRQSRLAVQLFKNENLGEFWSQCAAVHTIERKRDAALLTV